MAKFRSAKSDLVQSKKSFKTRAFVGVKWSVFASSSSLEIIGFLGEKIALKSGQLCLFKGPLSKTPFKLDQVNFSTEAKEGP